MTSSCAIFGRPSVVDAPTAPPPQLTLPAEARKPCPLYILPPDPLRVDLEIGYATRGAQIVACDASRETAVVTFDRQALAVAEQARARERRRSWPCRWLNAGC